jgi:hypothetical protein
MISCPRFRAPYLQSRYVVHADTRASKEEVHLAKSKRGDLGYSGAKTEPTPTRAKVKISH